MPDDTTILGLPLILANQAQKHVTHNEALAILDAVVQLAVIDRNRTVAPVLAAPGDRHIVAPGGVVEWAGQDGRVAVMTTAGWQFQAPRPGWRAHVLAEGETVVFDGIGWAAPSEGAVEFARLGVSATADATNRLAVSSPAVLLNHAGAGHQLKLNKAAAGHTASLLFQTGFSGRAEMGTAGSDSFQIKASADGSAWFTGLSIAGASGLCSFPSGLDAADLTRAGAAVYGRDNLLGTVSQVAGQPTGAVVERGSNANGDWLRLADGTQLCWRSGLSAANAGTADGALFRSANVGWTFPVAFSAVPVVMPGQAGDADCFVSVQVPTTAAVSARVRSTVSKAAAVGFSLAATGRWY